MLYAVALPAHHHALRAADALRLRHVPKRGPDLMTFVWGGMVVAGLAATLLLEPIITHFGPQMLYAVALPALAIVLVPLAMNYLGDEKLSEAQVAATRAKVWNQPEMLFLTGLIATGVVSIA